MALTFQFEEVSLDEANAAVARRTRKSDHAEFLQGFYDAGVESAVVRDLGEARDHSARKASSVAASMNTAIKRQAELGNELPIEVKPRRLQDGTEVVYMIRTDLRDAAKANAKK